MSQSQTNKYCRVCKKNTLFTRNKMRHLLHWILSIATFGIWFWLVYLPLGLFGEPYRCNQCGSKRSMWQLIFKPKSNSGYAQ